MMLGMTMSSCCQLYSQLVDIALEPCKADRKSGFD